MPKSNRKKYFVKIVAKGQNEGKVDESHLLAHMRTPKYWVAFITNLPNLQSNPGFRWNVAFSRAKGREEFIEQLHKEVERNNQDRGSRATG